MLMPDEAVNKNHFLPASKNQIRLTSQALSMKPIAIAQRMNKFSDNNFRLHILAVDLPHVFAFAFFT